MDLSDLQAKYGGFQRFQEQPQQPVQPKKVGGIKGLLAGLLPTIGGAIGAVGGTVAGPGGTVAGGAGGAALGEYLRQRLTGEDKDGIDKGNLLEQGAFGAIGALGKAKAVAGAAKATKTATVANSVDDLGNVAQSTVRQKAANALTQKGSGFKVGANVGDVTKMDEAAEVYQRLGIKGAPKTQLKKINTEMTRLGSEVDSILDAKPIKVDGRNVRKTIQEAIDDPNRFTELDLSSPEAQKALQQHVVKFGSAKNAKEINDYVKVVNKTAIRAQDKLTRGIVPTSKEQAALAAKYAGDDVLSQFPEIAPLKKDMAILFQRNPETAKIVGKSSNLPFVGGVLKAPASVARNIESRAGSLLAGGAKTAGEVAPTSFKPFAGQVARQSVSQAVPRVFAAPFMGQPAQEDPSQAPVDFSTDIIDTPVATPQMQPQMPESDSPFTQANIQQAIIADLQTTGGKNVSTLTKLYETFKPEAGAAEKPLSAEAAKTVSNAKAGLESIADFENITAADPNALKKTIIPGRGLFGGALGSALGTGEIEAASQQIIDIIARLRTGAAISATEEARFKKFIPQAFDSEETKAQKMGYLKRQFQRVAERSGAASTDLEAAVL